MFCATFTGGIIMFGTPWLSGTGGPAGAPYANAAADERAMGAAA